ncbi:NAD(P)-dependent oxidoreductase [Microlunatus panaciterrae]|uniref:Nucleoside-diphosphate-sugar epimerase n=1 Tax=Microlunatus panaciterrae TaxID=400768 RepID=A0ABS2RKX8_9ACTN|nr:NAD(P)-dependent oxidoreductase [Microlunatus panaciterrae]MBM7799147.1 nucleoside-diphosphate-sugar epimerase [Microlunatus panaciterrae]
MERVLVTGGCGRLGRAVVAELVAADYPVTVVDRVPRPDWLPDSIPQIQLDSRDVGQVAGALRGCDAVINLGAIPRPWLHPDEVVFTNNTSATFAVLQAAALLGIKRVAHASSASAYGTPYSPQHSHARYVPVDEDHPLVNSDPYGLSKEVDERTAEMFCRREGMSIACLRFHWVSEREEQLAAAERCRTSPDLDHELRNLWSYIDIRDAARACRLAIEAAKEKPYGFAPLNIVAADTLSEVPTEELIRRHAPDIEIRSALPGHRGNFAIDRAEKIIGWRPLHSWRDPE